MSTSQVDEQGRELLEPIVYERVLHGWAVPDAECETWDALVEQRENRGGVYATSAVAPRPGQQAKPIQQLVVELEAWLELDGVLEAELRTGYEAEPLRVTRIADGVVRGCEQRRLSSPGGLLRSRLRRLSGG